MPLDRLKTSNTYMASLVVLGCVVDVNLADKWQTKQLSLRLWPTATQYQFSWGVEIMLLISYDHRVPSDSMCTWVVLIHIFIRQS